MAVRLGLCSLLVVLIVSVGRAQAPPSTPPATQPVRAQTPQDVLRLVDQALATARSLLTAGDTTQATAVLTDARRGLETLLESDRRNVEARVLYGELLALAQEPNEARQHFKAVLELDPSNFRANLGLGRFYLESHIWRQAGAYLEAASTVAPRDRAAETLQLLAKAQLGQGERAQAISTAERAVAADPANTQSLELLIQMYMEGEQYDKALEQAKSLVSAARQRREENRADRTALEGLARALQFRVQALASYYTSLCRKDARGRNTDQLRPGTEAEAAELLSQIAYLHEEAAKLSWELSYHQTLAILEPVAAQQTAAGREQFENNTRYLLDIAGLLRATNQEQRAVQLLQRIASLERPTDADPEQARRNQQTAREMLAGMGQSVTSQPAPNSGS